MLPLRDGLAGPATGWNWMKSGYPRRVLSALEGVPVPEGL